MHVRVGEQVGIDTQVRGFGTHVAIGNLGTLAHDVTEMARQGEIALALHARHLNVQDVAAGGCHGQASGNTGKAEPFVQLGDERFMLQVFQHASWRHLHLLDLLGRDLHGDFATDGADPPLQVADPGFAGVVAHDFEQGLISKGNFLRT